MGSSSTDLETFISLSDLEDEDAAGNNLSEDSLPPWFRACSFIPNDPLISLNNEILDLCDLLQATKEEGNDTDEAISFVKRIVHDLYGDGATVRVFGSKMTGLSLPSSDIDCVICGVKPHAINTLGAAMYRQKNAGVVEKVEVVRSARVPIVKFYHISTGRAVDVSFNMISGIQMGIKSCASMNELPPVRPLVLLLKKFLQQRGLHETYHGGIGSFMLQIMVVRLVQDASRRKGPMQFNLVLRLQEYSKLDTFHSVEGSLFLDFLLLYGHQFNSYEVGLSIRNGGEFFTKQMRGWYDDKRPYLFSVENPEDISSDVGKNRYASIVNTPIEGLDAPCSFLKEVIYPDAELRARTLPRFPTFLTENFQHYGKVEQEELGAMETRGVGYGGPINLEHSEDSLNEQPRKRQGKEVMSL